MAGRTGQKTAPCRASDVVESGRGSSCVITLANSEQRPVALNHSARAIWDYSDGTRTTEDMTWALEQQLDLPAHTLDGDVAEAIEQLEGMGFVIRICMADSCPARDVDWTRMAEPQEDLYDIMQSGKLLALRRRTTGETLQGVETIRPKIFDSQVSVRYYYNMHGAHRHAPLNHKNITGAERLLHECWPLAHRGFANLMRVFHPVIASDLPMAPDAYLAGSRCHSDEEDEYLGTMWSSVNCPYMLAENFVHEMAHQKLFAVGVFKEHQETLLRNSYAHRFRSPILTTRARPMSAMLHGMYAYAYVTELDLRMLALEQDVQTRALLAGRCKNNVERLCAGFSEMKPHLIADHDGYRFMIGLTGWVESLCARASETLSLETGTTAHRMKCAELEGASGKQWRQHTVCEERVVGMQSWAVPRLEQVAAHSSIEGRADA